MIRKNSDRKRFSPKLLVSLLVVALLISAITLPGALASLLDTTTVVENQMEEAKVEGKVNLTQTRSGEKRYTVQNEGTIPALVRVKIVVNWLDENGNPMMTPPEGVSYQLKTGSGWTHYSTSSKPEDDYWFYNEILAPGEESTPVLTKVETQGSEELQVTVLAELVQAAPPEAIAEAWGMAFDDGTWSRAPRP